MIGQSKYGEGDLPPLERPAKGKGREGREGRKKGRKGDLPPLERPAKMSYLERTDVPLEINMIFGEGGRGEINMILGVRT